MDLEVSGTKGTKRQMSESVQLLKSWAPWVLLLHLHSWNYPPLWASHLVQESWLLRCTVQVVPSAFSCTMSHILSGLPSALVHNSCKKSDFGCVSFKGLQSGICLEGFAQRRVSVFYFYHWRLRLSLINLVARSRSQLFNLPTLFKPFVFLESPEALWDEGCIHLT